MSEWTREVSPMPTGPAPTTFGRLTLMKRKGGGDVQSIPLDAERITFGRDYDCDVRLYYSDVSKLHCEIVFDEVTGNATLRVLGTNGLLHTSAGGSATTYKPPATIKLSDRDLITIRKKPFRFEYGAGPDVMMPASPAPLRHDVSQVIPSPVKHQVPGSPGSQPLRRRASHRLSLVPEGKTFVPLSPAKPRRQSSLGLGGMGTPSRHAGKSKLNEIVHQEQEEEVEEEKVLDIAQGDEGDKVYLEVNEDSTDENKGEATLIHNNPFMTPQQTRKAPLRNTSAVPRTRRSTVAKESSTPTEIVAEAEVNETVPANPPKTPRSVPLPESVDTPYNPPATPAAAKNPNTPVSAKIAMSNPKGPATLRKALLLRSARKVWQETRATDVEGAIEKGDIEVRRKSLSPKVKSGRKSMTPVPEPEVAAPAENKGEEKEELAEEEAELGNDGELQWVQEDGTGEGSFDSESSGNDSLEADMSLDVPGQGIIEFSSAGPEAEEMYLNDACETMDVEEEDDEGILDASQENEEEALEKEDLEHEQSYEEFEQPIKTSADDSLEDAHGVDEQVNESEEEDDDMAMSLPGTPQRRQPIVNQFFTPQPARGGTMHARRSLGGIGGPPVRIETPSTPKLFGTNRTPGSLGKPSRNLNPSAFGNNEGDEEEDFKQEQKPFTPVKNAAAIADMKRRRETLATPRTLPAPPASGFKDPVRETRFANLVPTSTHPALAFESPEPAKGGHALVPPATPLDDLKAKLSSLRSKSVQQADRRATVGFVLPATPLSKPVFNHSHSYSVNPQRTAGRVPGTPVFSLLKHEEEPMAAESSTPTSSSNLGHGAHQSELHTKSQAPSSPEYEPPSSPSTPLYTGLREMLRAPQIAKTPNMVGLKHLFPATPKEVASPSLVGVKELLHQSIVPATPSFVGVRDMFQQKAAPPTPALEGVKEMYEVEEEEEEEEVEEVEVVKVAQEKEEEEEEEEIEEIEQQEMDQTEDVIVVDVAGDTESVEATGTVLAVEGEHEESAEEVTAPAPEVKSKLPQRTIPKASATTSSSASSRAKREVATVKQTTAKATTSKIPARRGAVSKAAGTADASEATSTSAHARKATQNTTTVISDTTSRSTRAKRTASVDPESASVSSRTSTSNRARSTRAHSTAEPEAELTEPATSKPSRGRSAPSRPTATSAAVAKKATETKAKEEPESKPGRAKNPLTQIEEQVVEAISTSTSATKAAGNEEKKSTSSRAKRATPASSTTSTRGPPAKKTATALPTSASDSAVQDKPSAPSRRRAVAAKDKENDETQAIEMKETEKPKRRAVSKVEEGQSAVPVPVARATRSRK